MSSRSNAPAWSASENSAAAPSTFRFLNSSRKKRSRKLYSTGRKNRPRRVAGRIGKCERLKKARGVRLSLLSQRGRAFCRFSLAAAYVHDEPLPCERLTQGDTNAGPAFGCATDARNLFARRRAGAYRRDSFAARSQRRSKEIRTRNQSPVMPGFLFS